MMQPSKLRFTSKRPFWLLVLLMLLFGVPLLLATFMWVENKPLVEHTTNKGYLLQPPLDFAALPVTTSSSPEKWQEHWLLLYVNPKACQEQCEQTLYHIRQVRTATGKHMDRVVRGMLSLTSDSTPNQNELNKQFAGTIYFTTSKAQLTTWLQGVPSSAMTLGEGAVYIIDPLGNVMMYYSLDDPAEGLFKDLTRLLRLSHIG